jgi:hypothetical protein
MESVVLGKWTEDRLNAILRDAAKMWDAGERIAFISEKFLDAPYQEKTLIGDINTPEVFVINLSGVDCFTFLDYVEAMRLSSSFADFKVNLKRVRYKSGMVAFENRNHFFSDWGDFNKEFIEDVTGETGGRNIVTIRKSLNLKEDGGYFIPGIQPGDAVVSYIPPRHIQGNNLKTGDYAGIYSDKAGLDVSHVGIIIKSGENIYLRHASFTKGKVVDDDFKEYMRDKPGLIVLRSK